MNYLSKSKQLYNRINSCSLISFVRFISTARLKDCHKILEVDKSSTPKQIKESFLRLSKIYHPDNKATGSHTKFVRLKEAYDEIKDAPTAPSDSYNSSAFNKAQEDLSHRTYARYRDQERSYYENPDDFARRYQEYVKRQPGHDPESPDEAWRRVRRNRTGYSTRTRREQVNASKFAVSPLTTFTIFLGAIAWIFVYSGFLLAWDYTDTLKKNASGGKTRSYEEYLAYREYVRKKRSQQRNNYEFPKPDDATSVAPAEK